MVSVDYTCEPNQIQFEDEYYISYLYDADGVKLRTIHIIDGDTLNTDYCDNTIYENAVLDKLLTNQRFITLSDAVYHYINSFLCRSVCQYPVCPAISKICIA